MSEWIIDDSWLLQFFSILLNNKLVKLEVLLILKVLLFCPPFNSMWQDRFSLQANPPAFLAKAPIQTFFFLFDPPGNGRIGGHYFHTCCPSVTKTRYNANGKARKNKTKNTMVGHFELSQLLFFLSHRGQTQAFFKAKFQQNFPITGNLIAQFVVSLVLKCFNVIFCNVYNKIMFSLTALLCAIIAVFDSTRVYSVKLCFTRYEN